MALSGRESGWLWHVADNPPPPWVEHPAVVLRVIPGAFLVIHGTSTPRDMNGRALSATPESPGDAVFVVEPASLDGRALGLSARTFFHRKAVELVRNEKNFRVTGLCPPALFERLRTLAGFTS